MTGAIALVGLTAPHSKGWLTTLRHLPECERLLVSDPDGLGRDGLASPEESPDESAVEWIDSIDDLLEGDQRPEMALLSVRNDQAAELAERFLRAGIACIVEKPCARSSEQIARLNEAASTGGVIWAPAFMNRLLPVALRARQIIAEGGVGRIVSVEGRMVTSTVSQRDPGHWLFDKSVAGGGILHWLAIHTVDLVRYLTGLEYTSVGAHIGTLSRTGIDVEDVAACSFQLQGGAVGSLHAGYVLRQRYGDIGLTIRGDLGEIDWPMWTWEGRGSTLYIHDEGPRSTGPGREVVELTPADAPGYGGATGMEFVRQFLAAACMGESAPFITNGTDALRAMQFVEAAYAAADSGQQMTPG
ncbi:MAG: Gfo/Idh/MocA family oxidoreductase, partial [Gemmatimonadetes bacterium]|nr:Gfo/Idh/MocA family oxidoreductase [Gemmatimonadota bacterium]